MSNGLSDSNPLSFFLPKHQMTPLWLACREMESELQDAILSTVPARLSMVLRDSAFHDYVSFLSKLSRLECSRLSHSTERRKR